MNRNKSTEDRIKEAARNIFMKQGFAGTKIRDIAKEAGINLALLNYYFRSKEKLFNRIMLESVSEFMHNVFSVFKDAESTLEQKFEELAIRYIDYVKSQPDQLYFVLNELRIRPNEFFAHVSLGVKVQESVFFNQLVEKIGAEKAKEINPLHFMMNLMSLILFPFMGKPILKMLSGITDEAFDQMLEERKKLIPVWINQMIA
ncbi:MAG: TetR/AcrR family transcriptional regulator [Cytophagales bacterium]|nr:TetR/AcrR family transcriptional regulator [Cytophagales bacterium]